MSKPHLPGSAFCPPVLCYIKICWNKNSHSYFCTSYSRRIRQELSSWKVKERKSNMGQVLKQRKMWRQSFPMLYHWQHFQCLVTRLEENKSSSGKNKTHKCPHNKKKKKEYAKWIFFPLINAKYPSDQISAMHLSEIETEDFTDLN